MDYVYLHLPAQHCCFSSYVQLIYFHSGACLFPFFFSLMQLVLCVHPFQNLLIGSQVPV